MSMKKTVLFTEISKEIHVFIEICSVKHDTLTRGSKMCKMEPKQRFWNLEIHIKIGYTETNQPPLFFINKSQKRRN